MSILNVEHLTHGFGDRAIFSDVSFRLLKEEHIGLVGANGEGKSTFMNIVTGKLMPDEGKVEWSKNVHAGYLDQHAVLEKGMTIGGVLKSAFDPLLQKEQRMNEICDQLGDADPEQMEQLMEELGTIQDELTLHDFYTIDAKVEEVARALGLLDLGLERDVTDLSGGQRTKVLLAKLLLEKPDILLLDEPTNYLDEEHIAWLKRYLLDYENAFILISHDIPFLNEVVNIIYHMENGYIGSLYSINHILEGLYDKEENWVLEMVDNAGNTVAQKGTPHREATISYDKVLDYTNVGIRVTVGSARLYSSKGTGVLILMGAMLFAVLLIFMVLGRQSRNVFEPLELLRTTMENYSGGDMDVRLPVVNDNSQIDNLYQTYNSMADQIEHLKIQVYEKELEKQRINSNYLRIQIKPHFYTNILNLFYGMAQMKDCASIQKLALACGRYFRYLLGQKGTFVLLGEELKCLDSYMEIQRYRYQDRFEAKIFVEPGLEKQAVLPLLIQTFFENSLKHNIMRIPLLQIEVAVTTVETEKMQITVKDNGIGFKQEILEKLERNESIEKGGEHIGIQNVKERIRVFFGETADMRIESAPGNTVVTLLLPLMIWNGESENEITSGR